MLQLLTFILALVTTPPTQCIAPVPMTLVPGEVYAVGTPIESWVVAFVAPGGQRPAPRSELFAGYDADTLQPLSHQHGRAVYGHLEVTEPGAQLLVRASGELTLESLCFYADEPTIFTEPLFSSGL